MKRIFLIKINSKSFKEIRIMEPMRQSNLRIDCNSKSPIYQRSC